MVYLSPIVPDNKTTDKDRKKIADKKTHLQFLSFFYSTYNTFLKVRIVTKAYATPKKRNRNRPTLLRYNRGRNTAH